MEMKNATPLSSTGMSGTLFSNTYKQYLIYDHNDKR